MKIEHKSKIGFYHLILLNLLLVSFMAHAKPTITAFAPASGAIGSSVTITGSGFNTTASQNIVFFGATQATVTAASVTSLTVTVPLGATYQYLSVTNLAVNLTAYSTKPFIVTLAGSINFASKVDFASGVNPRSFAIGDIDGDGKPDMTVANYNNNKLSVFRNTSALGKTSFATKVDFATDTKPLAVCIGDVDNDGKPDIAIINYGSNTVSIFRNTTSSGVVSFANKADFVTGGSPSSVSIGDIDGDGKVDLVVANSSNNNVSVLRNTSVLSTLNFAAKVDFATGTNPQAVSIGDIDGDGKPDVAVVNATSDNVSVLRNISSVGTLNFAAKVDFAASNSPLALSIGDLDGDGKQDLAIANRTSNTISVLRNTSTSGTLNFATKVDFATGTNPRSISIGDINGDGKPDVAVANANGNSVSLFQNNSTLGILIFAPKVDFESGTSPWSIGIGDIDGNGKPDIVVANANGNSVSVIRQKNIVITSFAPATGAIGSSVTINGTGFNATASQNIVFFGATQAMVTAASAKSLTVTVPLGATYQFLSVTNLASNLTAYSAKPFIVTLAGTTNFKPKADFATGYQPLAVSIGDIDGDGKPDLVVANFSSYTVSVIRNTSTSGTVNFAPKVDFATGFVPSSICIGDIDGDGKPDLVVSNNSNSKIVSILRNTSTPGIVSFAAKVDISTGSSFTPSISIGDFDCDGKPDLAVINANGGTVWVYRNTSVIGTITFANKISYLTGFSPNSVSIGDIDADGNPDLVVANSSINVSVLRNTSSTGIVSFANKVDFATGGTAMSVGIGDIDGDGKPDLAVANGGGNSVSILRNISTKGTPNFATKVDFATGSFATTVSIGDIDGDGKPDLAITNSNSNSISVFRNTSTSGTVNFATKVDFATGTDPRSVSIGDLDGDGKPDLAVANANSNNVSVFKQKITTPLAITVFSPATGAIGSSVTITGTGFNSTAAKNIVFFGATKAMVTAASADSLTVTVPLGATYQFLSVTNLAVKQTAYSSKPFVVSLAGSTSFLPKVDFTSSTSPYSVCIGDINGDGKADLAVVNADSNTVSVFRNNSTSGTIIFANKLDFATGINPYSLCLGDVNGDGKLDLNVANRYGSSISVLRNTSTLGSISFASKVDFGTGGIPFSISIGDLDGDGRPDLTVANISYNAASVFRNTSLSGIISFAPRVDFPTGAIPHFVSIGDINGDSKPDLAVACYTSNVSVLRNTSTVGVISFATKVEFQAGTFRHTINIGDIDGDGLADLAVGGGNNSNNISVLRNTSVSGTVSFATKVDFTVGYGDHSVSIGDIDGDGKPDLAVANEGSSAVSILRNTSTSGTVSFAAKLDLLVGSGPSSVNIGDLDGDGKPDLAFTLSSNNTVSVFRQINPPFAINTNKLAYDNPEVNSNSKKIDLLNSVDSKITIFPNPATISATLQFDALSEGKGLLTVYDIIGQPTFSKSIELLSGDNQFVLDLNALPKGIYYVRVDCNGIVRNKKLVVQ